MPYELDLDYNRGWSAAEAAASERATFIRLTYGHLAGAILAFVAIEAALFKSGVADEIVQTLFFGTGRVAWLMLLGLFIVGGYAAQAMAQSATSKVAQYLGLSLYVGLEVVIFLPLLYVADRFFPGQHLAAQAGIITLAAFAGLTLAVVMSGKDFSFLGPILWVASLAALGLVVAAVIFGFSLGNLFAYAMVVLAAGFIVYDTSNVMHRYRTDQYVAASLALFASVALMFYYVLRILMSLSGRSND